jgi:hypothetical protein
MASKRRQRRKEQRGTCGTKRPYETEEAAWHSVRHLRKQRSPSTVRAGCLRPYRCKFCGSWHIGNNKTRGAMLRFIEQATAG